MSSDEETPTPSDEENPTPSEIEISEAEKQAIPVTSRKKYEAAYKSFMDWRSENGINSFSENVLLTYFKGIQTKYKSSTMWSIYSMLRTMLSIKHDANMDKYPRLCALLKRNSEGYQPKKSKIFTPEQVNKFIEEAPDKIYLAAKVILIMGVMGSCRTNELYSLSVDDVEVMKTAILVKLPIRKTKTIRSFTVTGNFYEIIKRYTNLRPNTELKSFFLNYQQGRCNAQRIGINKMASMGKQIARYLQLPDANMYLGHGFKRLSATSLEKHWDWKSNTVAERHIDTSMDLENEICGTLQECSSNAQIVNMCTNTSLDIKAEVNSPPLSNAEGHFMAPRMTINRPMTRTTIDDTDSEIVRQIIYNMLQYRQQRKITTASLYESVFEAGVDYKGKINTFRRLIHRMGFRWRRTNDNRYVLIEKYNVRALRTSFLRKINNYRCQGYSIVYSSETSFSTSDWTNGNLVVMHAAGAKGLVPGAFHISKEEINHENYMRWIREQVIPNIEPNSMLVVDNMPYQNLTPEPVPTYNWHKSEMQQWLTLHNVFFNTNDTKPELYEKIQANKPPFNQYILDQIMSEHGHSVLRLPLYHRELNPMQSIWNEIRNQVSGEPEGSDLEKLILGTIVKMGVGQWERACEVVTNKEAAYLVRENAIDEVEEEIVGTDDESDGLEESDSENEEIVRKPAVKRNPFAIMTVQQSNTNGQSRIIPIQENVVTTRNSELIEIETCDQMIQVNASDIDGLMNRSVQVKL